MNTPVSFPIAKLLEEKGFDKSTEANWWILAKDHSENYNKKLPVDESKIFFAENSYELELKTQIDEETEHNVYHVLGAPTIAEVVMWLYEKHGVWIELTMGKDHTGVWFDWDIFSTITPRKDDILGEEGVEYEDDPNEKWLNYDTTYSSMIDERFATMDKESCSSPTEAYEAAIEYILKNLKLDI